MSFVLFCILIMREDNGIYASASGNVWDRSNEFRILIIYGEMHPNLVWWIVTRFLAFSTSWSLRSNPNNIPNDFLLEKNWKFIEHIIFSQSSRRTDGGWRTDVNTERNSTAEVLGCIQASEYCQVSTLLLAICARTINTFSAFSIVSRVNRDMLY